MKIHLRLLLLAALIAQAPGCNREPPDIAEAQATSLAEKEMPKWCDSEGSKCSDFKPKGKQKPSEAGFEWAFDWVSAGAERPMQLEVMVTKKGVVAVRMSPAPQADGSAPVAAAAAAPKPAAPKAPVAVVRDPKIEKQALSAVVLLAIPPEKKDSKRPWTSIICNPALWKRLAAEDPALKPKGLPTRVMIGDAVMERRSFHNQLAVDSLYVSRAFQKSMSIFLGGEARAATKKEQEKIQAYFSDLADKPLTVVEKGADTLLVQDTAGALTLDVLSDYPAPPVKKETAAPTAGAAPATKPGAAAPPAAGTPPASSPPPSSSIEEPAGSTFEEIQAACETEIGVLCLTIPASTMQVYGCLKPHQRALRASCWQALGPSAAKLLRERRLAQRRQRQSAARLKGKLLVTVNAPYGAEPAINGEMSEGEWKDAAAITAEGGMVVRLKHSQTHLFIAIPQTDMATLMLRVGDRILVLHQSAAIDHAVYALDAEAGDWKLEKGFDFKAWHDDKRAENDKMVSFEASKGWVSAGGSDAEFRIALTTLGINPGKASGSKQRIAFLVMGQEGETWPPSAKEAPELLEKIFNGTLPDRLPLYPQEWASLGSKTSWLKK